MPKRCILGWQFCSTTSSTSKYTDIYFNTFFWFCFSKLPSYLIFGFFGSSLQQNTLRSVVCTSFQFLFSTQSGFNLQHHKISLAKVTNYPSLLSAASNSQFTSFLASQYLKMSINTISQICFLHLAFKVTYPHCFPLTYIVVSSQ